MTLICITTCARVAALRANVWEFVDFAAASHSYSFLISLDGEDDSTLRFCEAHGIPVLFSKAREGVGISKNRVLQAFPSFDYYFFIEDDVSLISPDVFSRHLGVAHAYDVQHMSLGPPERFRIRRETRQTPLGSLAYFDVGTAQFNFFSRTGLNQVGGFHPAFARYRRFGHTEHSYRFVNAGLAPAAFCVIEDCLHGYIRTNEPRSATRIIVPTTRNGLFVGEEELIQQRLSWYPVTTIAHYQGPDSLSLMKVRAPKWRAFAKVQFWLEMWMLSLARAFRDRLHGPR